MVFDSFADATLSASVLRHILYGDLADESKGGHLYGANRAGKTEFPKGWTAENIELAIRSVCRSPHSVRELGKRIVLQKRVDDVVVEVWLSERASSFEVLTAFPIYGDEVLRNIYGIKRDLPINQREGRF